MASPRMRFSSILDIFISPEKRKSLFRTLVIIQLTMFISVSLTFYMVSTDIALFYVKWADANGVTHKSIIGAPIKMIYHPFDTDWLFRHTIKNTVCGYQDDCDASKITIKASHVVKEIVAEWPNCTEWKPIWYKFSNNGIAKRADEFR